MAQTQNHILDAALEVFSKKGFKAANVREIARKADVNISSINYYFKNKEGLYKTVIRTFTLSNVEWMVAALESEKPASSREEFISRFKTFINLFVKLISDNPMIFIILDREISEGLPYAGDEFKRVVPPISDALNAYMSNGKRMGFVRNNINLNIFSIIFHTMIPIHFKQKEMYKIFFDIDLDDTKVSKELFGEVSEILLNGVLRLSGENRA
jgi:AcrR family transcriptional regulator